MARYAFASISELNNITQKNRHPLSLISKPIECLAGAKYFTKKNIREACDRTA